MTSFKEVGKYFIDSESFSQRNYYSLSGTPEEATYKNGQIIGYFLDVYSFYRDNVLINEDPNQNLLRPAEFQNICAELGRVANSVGHFIYNREVDGIFKPERVERVLEDSDPLYSEGEYDTWLSEFIVTELSSHQSLSERLTDLESSVEQLRTFSGEELGTIRSIQQMLFNGNWVNLYANLPSIIHTIGERYRDGYIDYFGDENGRLTSGGVPASVMAGAAVGAGFIILGALFLMIGPELAPGFIISGIRSVVVAGLTYRLAPDQLLEDVVDIQQLPKEHMTSLGTPSDSVTVYPFGRNFSSLVSSDAFLVPKSHAANPPDHICIYSGAHKSLLVAATVASTTRTDLNERYKRLKEQVDYKRDRGVLKLSADSYARIKPMIPTPSPVSNHFDTLIREFPQASTIDQLK